MSNRQSNKNDNARPGAQGNAAPQTGSAKANNKGGQKEKDTSANMILFTMQNSKNDNDVILPTFTALLPEKNSDKHLEVRSLLDSASQSSFITKDIVDKINCRVIENNVTVQVIGFNGAETYHTQTVELKMRVGSELRSFEAIVVPKIDIKMKINGLTDVVNSIIAKNYKMADKNLCTDNINLISMILGADALNALPFNVTYPFGYDNSPAVLLRTDLGVILMGKASVWKNKLDELNNAIGETNSNTD